MESTMIKTSLLEVNKGQIEGLPKNPRFIRDTRFEQLKKSIQDAPEMLGLRELIVMPHGKKYVVIGGNMRLRACLDLGYTEIPCKVLGEDTPAEKLREYAVKDNNGFGQDDWDALANEWDEEELKGWGMEFPTEWGIEDEGKNADDAEEDDFDPDAHYETKVKAGEVWQLGEHRLMCGDSTKAEDFEKLMGGERADIAFTSPPYNLMGGFNTHPDQADGYLGGENAYNEYSDDRSDEYYAQFLSDVLDNCLAHSDDTFFNIGYTKGALIGTALFLGRKAKNFCGAISWVKSGCYMPFFPIQHGMLGNITEPVYIFSKESGRKLHHPTWEQGETSYNIVETKNAAGNDYSSEHSATFPVDFAGEFIRRFSHKSVLDCFGGTGTTMIAAEQLGRKCYMMELDHHYCDVIIARWEKLTGRKAELLTRN